MSKLILVVDDEASIRISLVGILEDEGYHVLLAENGSDALDIIREEVPDLVLLDIWMPGMDGIQVLERIKNLFPDLTVVMMSGHGTIETAVKATRIGAFDFIEKPFSLDKVLITIGNALSFKELRKENEALRLAALKEHEMVGSSAVLEFVRSQVQKIAPASTPVLVLGEDGVGKELVARAIHNASTRREKLFVSVNCMAVPEELLADELFGHERGAYAGANSQKRGRLDLADGGTLFLDEVHELSLKSQGELLRVVSEQSFERCGGTKPVRVDVRVIAATSHSLVQAVKDGLFRDDLYQCLQIVPLVLSPLRERRDDIPQLVHHFIQLFHRREGWEPKSFDVSAIRCLQQYDWPGNVRELKNIVERILIMAAGPVIYADDLPQLMPGGHCGARKDTLEELGTIENRSLGGARDRFEREYILLALEQSAWNIDKAAQSLEIERTVLQRKLVQYGVTPVTER
jgi:two-component system, NtrC family, nitrogen regulation response regulator NtrX